MSKIVFGSKIPGRKARIAALPKNGGSMLRAELELMIDEDTYLKKIAGAAALLVARLDRVSLHGGAALAAFTLARLIEGMPDDMVIEAMDTLKSS